MNSLTSNTEAASVFEVSYSIERKKLENTILKLLRVCSHLAGGSLYVSKYDGDNQGECVDHCNPLCVDYEIDGHTNIFGLLPVRSDFNSMYRDASGRQLVSYNVIFAFPKAIMKFLKYYASYDVLDLGFRLSGNIRFSVDPLDEESYVSDLGINISGFNFDVVPDCYLRKNYKIINEQLRNVAIFLDFVEPLILDDIYDDFSESVVGSFEELFDFLVNSNDRDITRSLFLCEATRSIAPLRNLIEKQRRT